MHFQFLIVDPGCYDLVENLSIETNTRSISVNVGSSGLTYRFCLFTCLFTFLVISSWNTASFSLNLNLKRWKSIDVWGTFIKLLTDILCVCLGEGWRGESGVSIYSMSSMSVAVSHYVISLSYEMIFSVLSVLFKIGSLQCFYLCLIW